MALNQPCKKRHHPDDEDHLTFCLSKRPLVSSDAGLSSSIHSDLDSITCSEAMPKAWNPSSRTNVYHTSLDPDCSRSSYMTTSEVTSTSVGLAFRGRVLAGTKQSTFESLCEMKSRGRWLPDHRASESSQFDSEASEVTIDRTQKSVSMREGVVFSNPELPSGSMWRSLGRGNDATRHQAAGNRFSDQGKYESGPTSLLTGSIDLRWQGRQGKAKRCSSESGSSCGEAIGDSPSEGKQLSHKLELPHQLSKKFPIMHGASREARPMEKSWITRSSCGGDIRGTGNAEGLGKGPHISYVLSSGRLSLEEDSSHDSDGHGSEVDKRAAEKPRLSYVLSSGRVSVEEDSSHEIDSRQEAEDDEQTTDGPRPSYVLSSGRLSLEEEARLGRRAPTIDHDFEEYFSALML